MFKQINMPMIITLLYLLFCIIFLVFIQIMFNLLSLNVNNIIIGFIYIFTSTYITYIIINTYYTNDYNLELGLKTIINTFFHSIIVYDEDGKILMSNNIWQNFSKYNMNNFTTIEQLIHQVYKNKHIQRKEVLSFLYLFDQGVQDKEIDFEDKNNNKLILRLNLSSSFIFKKRKVIILNIFNITNNKNEYIKEIQKQKNISKLSIKEIEDKERRLLQKSTMLAMNEILENIAHQWRQPLNVISTVASGVKLQQDLNLLNDDFLLESMEQINKSTQDLSSTINNFKNYFTPNKEIFLLEFEEILYKTMQILKTKFNSYDIQIISNIENFKIKNNDNALIQIFITILNNAKDVLIKNNPDKKYIFIDIYKENYKAIIKIKDNGGGIKANIINKIFEPYFTTKHQGQNTGIGLFLIESTIEKHMNGKISVKNEHYKYSNQTYIGANFTIELPLKV